MKYPIQLGIPVGKELFKFETEANSIEEAKENIENCSKCVIANIYDKENNILHHFCRTNISTKDEESVWHTIPRGEFCFENLQNLKKPETAI